MVSSEVESLARTGGLGDVVEALSRALGAAGVDVVVATPKYGVTRVPEGARWWPAPVVAPLGRGHLRALGVLAARLGSAPLAPRACMLADAELFDRAGIYGESGGTFDDNAFRFATLSSGALAVAERAWEGSMPDVVHAHDWHAALAVVYARKTRGARWARVPLVFTIHNLAYQGVIDAHELDYLGVPREGWEAGWIRDEGDNANLMRAGLELADCVTTVSRSYAAAIQQAPNGFGLEALLAHHRQKLVGIVNGIDTESFDPASDGAIARRYSVADAAAGASGEARAGEGKRACKQALQAELGLEADVRAPLFGAISRLQWLKGTDLLLRVVPALVERGAQLVLVGTGEASLEAGLRAAAARWPGRVAARVAFDPRLARRVYAGADFFVVPSRDEPCGLTQLYAMRYGTVPVVTPVGGLRDTVIPLEPALARGTGFVADRVDEASLLMALEEALSLWRDPVGMASAVARAMARDSSWSAPASEYMAVYERLAATASWPDRDVPEVAT